MRLDYNYYICEINMKDIFKAVTYNEKFEYVNKLLSYHKSIYVREIF